MTVAFGKVSGAALLVGLLLLAAQVALDRRSRRSRTCPAARPGPRRWCCCSPGSRSRRAWCRSRSGCRAGTRPHPARPARSWRACASTSRSTACGARSRCSAGRRAGSPGSCCCSAGSRALLGIAHAAVSSRLSRVIAYSSVENSGLIITGFGVALTGAAVGDQQLVAVGLLAATLQMVAHTVGEVAAVQLPPPGLEAAARQRRPGGAARHGAAGAVERHRPGGGRGDAGRAAADGRVRVRVVPARVAHAAVPGDRARRAG